MPDTSLLFGPFLLGGCFNLVLYGVCVVQTLLYFQSYRRDPLKIRLLVAYLIIMETINSGCTIGLLYEPLVLHYGDPVSFMKSPVMLAADALTTVLISTPVQIFVAWRLKIVSRSNIIPILISLLALVSLAGGARITVSVIQIRDYGHFGAFTPIVIVWLSSAAVADFLITTGLTWSLFTRKSGVKETDEKVSRIIRLTIQTGFVTMAVAIADLIIFVARPNTTLNFIPDFMLSKLYTNSLLSTLNARSGWNNLGHTHEVNVLFDRSELSATRKRPEGVESATGVDRVGSLFIARTNSAITGNTIELQTTVTVQSDDMSGMQRDRSSWSVHKTGSASESR